MREPARPFSPNLRGHRIDCACAYDDHRVPENVMAEVHVEAEAEYVEADKARLSPLKDKHVNVLGRYTITPSQPARGLRPLRDPATVEEGEVDF